MHLNYSPIRAAFLGIALAALNRPASAAPLAIDVSTPVPAITESPVGPGASRNPQGHEITLDSRSLLFDGQPFIPVCGEFHYSRVPRADWRDELLKLKAGGLDVVSTYVFWIHHEEEQGKFDWSGDRSLRDFLKLCQETGLKAIVRIGPWCHGEVRNGGFPDWVLHSGTKLRSTDPNFLALVKPFYAETARQLQGLLWKEGGPVIAVQIENEYSNPPYLLALKKLAQEDGLDVPFYTMTGWNRVEIPKEGLLPLFGAYSDGFWGGTPESYRKVFMFSAVRDDGDLGAQMQNVRPGRNLGMEAFPYACAEIGAGMASSYAKRIKVHPDDLAAMAMVKLGCGNNMPGYYMYQGGANPEGKLSTLQEEKPNSMPVKDYDFQAPLGAAGQVREQFHLLREQHLFLQDFGSRLARLPAFFPIEQPKNLKDFETLRWSVRADETGSGFLFFNNHQPILPMGEKKEVQFAVKTASGTLLVPAAPVTIATGAYGIWPIRLDCDGVLLNYATVQPLGRVPGERGDPVYFFSAIAGVRPELAVEGKAPIPVSPGTCPALIVQNQKGTPVTFVVLTPEQARDFYRTPFAGRTRALLSQATVFADGPDLRLQADTAAKIGLAIFPPMPELGPEKSIPDGLFARFALPAPASAPVTATATLEKPPGPNATSQTGLEEAAWADAAVYRLQIPDAAAGRRVRLDIHYLGDAARIYAGDKLILDNFYNGDPVTLPLWRISREDWPKLRLKVLPCTSALPGRLPEEARPKVLAALSAKAAEPITVSAVEPLETRLAP